ncbi:hypothetical protein KKC94_01655 [Patescibacteria group bacterium]|nr:hypothetical protein [Patescibacteria group bacterium]
MRRLGTIALATGLLISDAAEAKRPVPMPPSIEAAKNSLEDDGLRDKLALQSLITTSNWTEAEFKFQEIMRKSDGEYDVHPDIFKFASISALNLGHLDDYLVRLETADDLLLGEDATIKEDIKRFHEGHSIATLKGKEISLLSNEELSDLDKVAMDYISRTLDQKGEYVGFMPNGTYSVDGVGVLVDKALEGERILKIELLGRAIFDAANKDDWDSVEEFYKSYCEMSYPVAIKSSFNFDFYGAIAAWNTGDAGNYRSRLENALKNASGREEKADIEEKIRKFDAKFSLVNLDGTNLEVVEMPLNSEDAKTIQFAQKELTELNIFRGKLPNGEYILDGEKFLVVEDSEEPIDADKLRSDRELAEPASAAAPVEPVEPIPVVAAPAAAVAPVATTEPAPAPAPAPALPVPMPGALNEPTEPVEPEPVLVSRSTAKAAWKEDKRKSREAENKVIVVKTVEPAPLPEPATTAPTSAIIYGRTVDTVAPAATPVAPAPAPAPAPASVPTSPEYERFREAAVQAVWHYDVETLVRDMLGMLQSAPQGVDTSQVSNELEYLDSHFGRAILIAQGDVPRGLTPLFTVDPRSFEAGVIQRATDALWTSGTYKGFLPDGSYLYGERGVLTVNSYVEPVEVLIRPDKTPGSGSDEPMFIQSR